MIQSFLNKHTLNMSPPKLSQQLALVGKKNHAAIGKMSNLKIGNLFSFFKLNRESSELFPPL